MTATPTPTGRRMAIRPFAELSREDVAFAGGKGANLGELVAAHVPVPPGFVVGAPAYAAFCEETGVRDWIAALLDPVDVDDTEALGTAARAARELLERAAMPRWLRDAIAAAYDELVGDEPSLAGCGVLVGNRRGHGLSVVRGHERDVPERPRCRRRGRRGAPLLGVVVRQPNGVLSGQARLLGVGHGHRGRRPGAGRVDAGRCDVHRRPCDGEP